MPPSLFPSDDNLPTWLHSLLLFGIVSPFAGFLIWHGILAIASAQLEPLLGPDGEFFFGSKTLFGLAARMAGLSFLILASSFLAIAFRFSRFAQGSVTARVLPWGLLIAWIVISTITKRLN